MDLVAATTLVYSAIGAAGVVADLTRLAIGAEMQTALAFARDRSGFERLAHYEPVLFFVSLPARSRWRSSTRLRIRVEAEEISALEDSELELMEAYDRSGSSRSARRSN